jgi:hypothetical protein
MDITVIILQYLVQVGLRRRNNKDFLESYELSQNYVKFLNI